MPLVGTGLGAVLYTEITSAYGGPPPTPAGVEKLQNFCNAVGEAVVSYIQENALVVATVESGVGAGGSVTGTIE